MTGQRKTDEERHELIGAALQRLIDGESINAIANASGLKPSTLHSWLLGEVPEKYRAIQQQGLIARIVQGDEDIDNASSHLEVARAREKARFARWDAERRLKNLFGPSQEISGPGGGPIQLDNGERARRAAFLRTLGDRQVIDLEPESSQPSPVLLAST